MRRTVDSNTAETGEKTMMGVTAFLAILLVPACVIVCIFCVSLLSHLAYVNKMSESTSQEYLPNILAGQRIILDIENLRRYAEIVYSTEDPSIRRSAATNATALSAESVFEQKSPFAKYAGSAQKLLRELTDARTDGDHAVDSFHHEEIFLTEKVASLTAWLKLPPVNIPGHNSKHLCTASEREKIENGLRVLSRLALQPIYEACHQLDEASAANQQTLETCTVLRDSELRLLSAWETRLEADSRARIAWKHLDTQLREISHTAFATQNELTYTALSGLTSEAHSSSTWIKLFLFLLVFILVVALVLFYCFIISPIMGAASHLKQLRAGIVPDDLPAIHLREMQTLLNTLPRMSRQISELSDLSGELAKEKDKYVNMSYVDALTGVNNRRSFDKQLALESRTHNLAILMLDVDHFKRYNDSLGHQAGDTALVSVAHAMEQALLRSSDRVFRYGGEEFTVILPDATEDAAMAVAARILITVRNMKIPHPASPVAPMLTVSIGVSSRENANDCTDEELVAQADMALYRAKSSGRNRICVYLPGDVSPPAEAGNT